jgi:NTP pyrophosphatase (non-canonical NTP hydrolase)
VTEPDAAGPGFRLADLVAVMDTLRRRCPWDARQTHESLAPHLLEETYEAIDALGSGDQAAFRDELGDVLLQVVFHARIAQERTDGTGYTIDDVADGIIAKLTRRHPHVFGDVSVSGPDEVKQNWDAIKAAERAAVSGGPVSALDGVPMSQPALALAAQLLRRAGRTGAPAELAGFSALPAAEPGGPGAGNGESPAVSDLGRRLFALVAEAQDAGLDAEMELRAAARAYDGLVRRWEAGT